MSPFCSLILALDLATSVCRFSGPPAHVSPILPHALCARSCRHSTFHLPPYTHSHQWHCIRVLSSPVLPGVSSTRPYFVLNLWRWYHLARLLFDRCLSCRFAPSLVSSTPLTLSRTTCSSRARSRDALLLLLCSRPPLPRLLLSYGRGFHVSPLLVATCATRHIPSIVHLASWITLPRGIADHGDFLSSDY